ncbi:hypothetical protein VNI00_008975 [Paramarasmius palmivorus]|uniref:Uncharacterized protein n=1 Tax=Paramarasmius palmivorus TaxID=297713 RepID=A0AAW0CSW1_9AGAR
MPQRKRRQRSIREIKEANRRKSSTYYYRQVVPEEKKNRETILAKHKAHRERAKRNEEIDRLNAAKAEFQATKDRNQQRFQQYQAAMGRDATDFLDPLGRLQRLRSKMKRETHGSVSQYIDNAFRLTMQIRASGARYSSTPLTKAYEMFSATLSTIDRLQNLVLNDHGAGSEYQRVEAFRQQVRWILRCLDDIDMYILDPDEDPQIAYDRRKLAFQDSGNQEFIDGRAGAPDTDLMSTIGRS